MEILIKKETSNQIKEIISKFRANDINIVELFVRKQDIHLQIVLKQMNTICSFRINQSNNIEEDIVISTNLKWIMLYFSSNEDKIILVTNNTSYENFNVMKPCNYEYNQIIESNTKFDKAETYYLSENKFKGLSKFTDKYELRENFSFIHIVDKSLCASNTHFVAINNKAIFKNEEDETLINGFNSNNKFIPNCIEDIIEKFFKKDKNIILKVIKYNFNKEINHPENDYISIMINNYIVISYRISALRSPNFKAVIPDALKHVIFQEEEIKEESIKNKVIIFKNSFIDELKEKINYLKKADSYVAKNSYIYINFNIPIITFQTDNDFYDCKLVNGYNMNPSEKGDLQYKFNANYFLKSLEYLKTKKDDSISFVLTEKNNEATGFICKNKSVLLMPVKI